MKLRSTQRSTQGSIFRGLIISIVLTIIVSMTTSFNGSEFLSVQQYELPQQERKQRPLKILYTITTLAEYDKGKRKTIDGYDRLQNTLIPVMKEAVESMLRFGYEVDVFIVAFYKMTRFDLIRNSLPPNVNLTVWDEAAPISYKGNEYEKEDARLFLNTLGLARQHRFVIKDHLLQYDLFCNFEDDMMIKGDHVSNYLQMTKELYRLRATAPEHGAELQNTWRSDNFFGPLSKEQLKRTFPGFIRVEALLDEEHYGTQKELDPIPIQDRPDVDPKPCCHLYNTSSANANRPAAPLSNKLFLWETTAKVLGVRHMPEDSSLKWVLMQRGPHNRGLKQDEDFTISDYWSNRDHYFEGGRQLGNSFRGINNQGGWMATRQQIWEWHTEVCPGGFLPPYDAPNYNHDGLDLRNVEWWSGGLSLFTKFHSCNMQRLISLEPSQFSRHLLYHSANNKQRQLAWKNHTMIKVNDFYAQLLTVKKNAQREKDKQEREKKDKQE